ncbi:MAG: dephospho-CoA kinase [Bacteroidaceae bacterium]|nr:dephospho-CoA kinase [Bacteroidaceae bacterium]
MHYAITGGIASGKSWFCSKLQHHGNEVYSCDEAAKRIIRTNTTVKQLLTSIVGEVLYDQQGNLQKRILANFITTSAQNAAQINAVVHPLVAADYCQWRDNQSTQHTFMECALLYESGFDRLVDRVILIYANEATRLQRLMKRDNISLEQARAWLTLQMPEEEKRQRADIIIYNE